MSTLALVGWGQPHDALREVAPGAHHVSYRAHASLRDTFAALLPHRRARVVVGWSMGGQIAVRAIAEGVLKPERLVLIATPFRFVQQEEGGLGLGRTTFSQYQENFARNPERTLKKSYALIAHEDTRAETVGTHLADARSRLESLEWAHWLSLLEHHSAEDISFAQFPPTLLVHGDRDVVVEPAQSAAFHARMPRAVLHVFEGCGHAPHWHDAPRVRALIAEHVA